jgi:hypothetical protein
MEGELAPGRPVLGDNILIKICGLRPEDFLRFIAEGFEVLTPDDCPFCNSKFILATLIEAAGCPSSVCTLLCPPAS